jgi:predicted Fe-Mo cluster-binding NifX family protein
MLDVIRDCDVLLAHGMGKGDYESIRQAGIKPVLMEVDSIDIAVQQHLAGCLIDHVERLH